ncbi:hypothetical protein V8G54_031783 [Vigna mungo]|uniref:Serine aminopeptidase S33 domain-containing protein n=1 Tax=Vigna mungo TaxID=3915 RepID=A0AAQ3RI82_VIGMU
MATETYAIKYEEEHILNSRGLKLFTCRWLPANRSPKALIFMCHGYAMECSITMNSTGIRLSQAGFAMFGIDYEGHGKSEGVPGLVMNFDTVIDDCLQHFSTISGLLLLYFDVNLVPATEVVSLNMFSNR